MRVKLPRACVISHAGKATTCLCDLSCFYEFVSNCVENISRLRSTRQLKTEIFSTPHCTVKIFYKTGYSTVHCSFAIYLKLRYTPRDFVVQPVPVFVIFTCKSILINYIKTLMITLNNSHFGLTMV